MLFGAIIGAAVTLGVLLPRLSDSQRKLDDIYHNAYGGEPEETKRFERGLLDILGPEEALEYVKEDYKSRVIDKTSSDQAIQTVLMLGYLRFLEEGRTEEAKSLLASSVVSFYKRHRDVPADSGPFSDTLKIILKKIDETRLVSTILNEKLEEANKAVDSTATRATGSRESP